MFQKYVEDPDRHTLSLSYKGRTGDLISRAQQVVRRVPPFFPNLLPEGHLRTYLAEQAGVNPEREFFLLAVLGQDLTGAVTVHAEGEETTAEDHPSVENVTSTANSGSSGEPLRFSLAGVQLKFSAVMNSAGGLTIPAQGIGGSWILKLPSLRFEAIAENEFVMLELARAVGVPVPSIRLMPVTEVQGLPAETATMRGNALAVERFDRGPGGQRIHMEDFAQVFGSFPERKYQDVSYANIARVLCAEAGPAGTYEFVKRLVFSVLIGNADMHLKNWSLLYRDARGHALSCLRFRGGEGVYSR